MSSYAKYFPPLKKIVHDIDLYITPCYERVFLPLVFILNLCCLSCFFDLFDLGFQFEDGPQKKKQSDSTELDGNMGASFIQAIRCLGDHAGN